MDGLLLVLALPQGDGQAQQAVRAGNVAAVAVAAFLVVLLSFDIHYPVMRQFGKVLDAGEVVEFEEGGCVQCSGIAVTNPQNAPSIPEIHTSHFQAHLPRRTSGMPAPRSVSLLLLPYSPAPRR